MIKKWEDAGGNLLTKRNIIEGLNKEGKPQRIDRGKMGIEYQFETRKQGKYQVLLGEGTEKHSCPPVLKNGQRAEIERDLTINQALGQTVSEQENPQIRVVNFLEAKWSELAGIFSSEKTVSPSNLRSFTNMRVGSMLVDFIGVEADGRYMVFEIAKPGRKSQAGQHRKL